MAAGAEQTQGRQWSVIGASGASWLAVLLLHFARRGRCVRQLAPGSSAAEAEQCQQHQQSAIGASGASWVSVLLHSARRRRCVRQLAPGSPAAEAEQCQQHRQSAIGASGASLLFTLLREGRRRDVPWHGGRSDPSGTGGQQLAPVAPVGCPRRCLQPG